MKQTKQAALDEGIYRQSGSVVYGYGTIPGNRAKKIPKLPMELVYPHFILCLGQVRLPPKYIIRTSDLLKFYKDY